MAKARAKAKPGDRRLGSKANVGNEYWRNRKTTGRPRKYPTPDHLWDACVDYFKWVEANPLQETKIFSYQGKTHTGTVSKMRAMTVRGLCTHIGIDFKTWRNYDSLSDFLPIKQGVSDIIYVYKFEGAAANLLDPRIIARELGRSDR